MWELRSLIYRLVISKSLILASSQKQEQQYSTVIKYSAVRLSFFYEVRYAGTVLFFVMLQLRYVSTVRFKVRSTQILNVPYRTAILSFAYINIVFALSELFISVL